VRLTSFHIKKYRSIEDSGEIRVDENVTTFVGINESGKTNVMRALKKINHTSDTDFDELTEHPMWHFGNFDPEEIFVTVTFKLNNEEKDKTKEISNGQLSLEEIKFSRKKNMKLICHLDTEQEAIPFEVFNKIYLQPIHDILDQIEPDSIKNGQGVKDNVINTFKTIGQGYKGELNVRQPKILEEIKQRIENFKGTLPTLPDDVADKDEINTILGKMNSEVTEDSTEEVKNYLIKRLPRFIYFENIAIIDSRIHLPSFVEKLDANDLDGDEKTAKTLLDLGSLDAHELLKLGLEGKDREKVRKNKDRLDLLCSLASKKVSEEIDKIWEQNDHDIEFSVQGKDLRVWVINRKDKTKLQLEERSRGYQWYFSFYTVFNVESEKRHKDAILLLDEPALFLHQMGQEDFINKILPKLVEKNQILYTTHSPFMINLKKPDSIHTVTLKETEVAGGILQKITHISDEVWDSDRNALFPLQYALNYTLAQTMFIGKKNLIVEGVTDFWILSSASSLFESASKLHLKKDFVFVPVGGATRSVLFASTYKSQELDVGVLLDADHEGKSAYDVIVKNKILRDKKVSLLNEIFNKTDNMSLEDIFPEDYYLKFVESTYQKELSAKGITNISLTSQDPMIVRRIEEFFKEKGLEEFHKSRPARALLNEFGKVDIGSLPDDLVKNFETVFEAINKLMK